MLWRFEKVSIESNDLLVFANDLTDQQKQVCVSIYNIVKPYMPSMEHSGRISRQLPLVLLSNDLLRQCGYEKLCEHIFPRPKPSHLNWLHLDAASIYQRQATWNKEDCFASFFNVQMIEDVCTSYGLKFAHTFMVGPGVKTVRIHGTLKSSKSAERLSKLEQRKKELASQQYASLKTSDRSIIEQEVKDLDAKAQSLNQELASLCRNGSLYKDDAKIKELKTQWSSNKSLALHQKIRDLKASRFASFVKIEQVRESLKSLRSQAYHKRQVSPSSSRFGIL